MNPAGVMLLHPCLSSSPLPSTWLLNHQALRLVLQAINAYKQMTQGGTANAMRIHQAEPRPGCTLGIRTLHLSRRRSLRRAAAAALQL